MGSGQSPGGLERSGSPRRVGSGQSLGLPVGYRSGVTSVGFAVVDAIEELNMQCETTL